MLGQYVISDSIYSGWTSSCYSTCNGQTIMGGYGCFGSGWGTYKYYDITTTHYQVSIEFDAYWIDSWDGEYLYFYVDWDIKWSQSKPGTMAQYCGVSTYDYVSTVTVGPISHTSSTLVLYFWSSLDQGSTDESWGFTNLKITVWPYCATGCSACYGNLISQCTSCSSGYYLSGSTCVTDCGAYYWNNPTGRVCSRNFYLNFHSIYTFFFSLSFFLL